MPCTPAELNLPPDEVRIQQVGKERTGEAGGSKVGTSSSNVSSSILRSSCNNLSRNPSSSGTVAISTAT